MNLSTHLDEDAARRLRKKIYDAERNARLRNDPAHLEKRRHQNRTKNQAWRARNLEKAREHTRKWRAKNPDRVNALARATKAVWMAKPENRIRHCLGAAKRRALTVGMEFSITVDDLLPLPLSCPVLGVSLNYGGTGANGFVNNSPSIDRIDSSRGYVKGNVQVISWRANRIKADATLDELRALVAYMETKSCN